MNELIKILRTEFATNIKPTEVKLVSDSSDSYVVCQWCRCWMDHFTSYCSQCGGPHIEKEKEVEVPKGTLLLNGINEDAWKGMIALFTSEDKEQYERERKFTEEYYASESIQATIHEEGWMSRMWDRIIAVVSLQGLK